ISPGSHTVAVVLNLPNGKRRLSNPLVANLLPTLNTAAISGGSLVINPVPPPPGVQTAFATIDLSGVLLGNREDDCFLALYRDGRTVRLLTPSPTKPRRRRPRPFQRSQQRAWQWLSKSRCRWAITWSSIESMDSRPREVRL